MTRLQRIKNMIFGIALLVSGLIIFFDPHDGYIMTCYILAFFLITAGVRGIIYFFVMARHMIEGTLILVRGVIMLDLSAFTLTLLDLPRGYVIVYLLALHLLNGLKEILRGLEIKRYQVPRWKLRIAFGCANVLTALGAVILGIVYKSNELVIMIFSGGMIYSAGVCILAAFRKTEEVMITQ